ncbi:MAG: alpha/beta fold hydrolase [Bacteroidia bacterium]|nr:alpha/beta fold hydrolase [Bacteroidia bacterium]
MLTLNYKSFGQGPALLILHGLFGSLDNWASLAKQFGEEFSVYLIDQRNHGRSPHTDEWNYGLMAEDLHDFMDQHGIMQAHLLGHSMGGKTVMTFAGEYPERIDKLIVADMGIRQYPPHHEEVLKAIAAVPLDTLVSRQQAEEIISAHLDDQGVIQFLLKSLGRDEEKRFRWKFNFEVISQHYQEVLAPLSMPFPFEGPTLFLTGVNSHYVRPEDHDSILMWFPQARFEAIADAGHWLHADQPEAFQMSVASFLEE